MFQIKTTVGTFIFEGGTTLGLAKLIRDSVQGEIFCGTTKINDTKSFCDWVNIFFPMIDVTQIRFVRN